MNRRGLLKMFGLSPIAAATGVASQALTAAGFSSLGTKIVNTSLGSAGIGSAGSVITQASSNQMSQVKLAYEAWKLISGKSLPDHKVESLRKEAQYTGSLDSDLVMLKSYSLTTKIRMQKERNFKRLCKEAEADLHKRFANDDFTGKFGFDVW